MKKLIKKLIAVMLVCIMIPSTAFAEAVCEGEIESEETAGEEVAEILSYALNKYMKDDPDIQMKQVGPGIEYCRKVYELENNCQFIMEFEDGEEGTESFIGNCRIPVALHMAANGETMWKDYGNRYFTAKATVTTAAGSVYVILENHYTLSESGIDERYGVAKGEGFTSAENKVNVIVLDTNITDSSARTVGKSDVNIEANYKISATMQDIMPSEKIINLSTAVGYVDHNYNTRQIKVKHSWSLN
ncbi:MAG: hypothetical protein ACI4LZ_01860 [Anaerovoracaceae bacterium]